MTRNMYRINNKSNGVVRMYVTTSCFLVFHRLSHATDCGGRYLYFITDFARYIAYSKLCSFHKLFVNRNVCQISMHFEEANCAWDN